MPLFKIQKNKVKKIFVKNINYEKDLQKLFEENLEEILNIVFLASEFSTGSGGRIDSLGIDKNGSPVIIEYKKLQNDNVINQGLSYLRWLLDHKANFEMLCKKRNINLEIDWNSPRVICIAESYNKFDLDTVDILPINIELFRYLFYEEDLINIEPVNYQKIKIPMSGITRKAKAKKDKQEVIQKVYSVEEHIEITDEKIKEIFFNLREKITSLDENIVEEAKTKYVAYKVATNFVDIVFMKNCLKIFLNLKSGQLNDPKGIARDLTKPKPVGHWGNGDYEVKIKEQGEINDIFEFIKQSYMLNK